MSILETLKKERKRQGLTLSDLALRLGVTEAAICCWENGTRDPKLSMVQRWAKALGLAVMIPQSGDHEVYEVTISVRKTGGAHEG